MLAALICLTLFLALLGGLIAWAVQRKQPPEPGQRDEDELCRRMVEGGE